MAQAVEAIFYRGMDQNRTDYVPASDVLNGVVVDVGERIGIVTDPQGIAANRMGSLATQNVFKLKKTVAVAIDKGARVFWDTVNRTAQGAAGASAIYAGIADEACVAGDDHVKTDINRYVDQALTSPTSTTTTTTTAAP